MRPWFLHLILALLMVSIPSNARFEVIELDEDHEKTRSQATKQVATERFEQPSRQPRRIHALTRTVFGNDPGFRPIPHAGVAELARRGAAERRML